MERSSSFGSQGSGKSGQSSATKIAEEARKHQNGAESQNTNNGFTTALFGVLFTLAKEKFSDSWQIAVTTVVVDFLLILAIFLNLEYPWAVDAHNPLWKFFFMLEIHKPLAATGYKFYIVVFYLLSSMLFLCVGICVWVAWCFKNDSFPFLWPIKFVRVVVSVFFGMLYIAALNIFLVIYECGPEHGVWKQHIWHKECFTMPHLIHIVVALACSATFAVAALLLVVADHELDPRSKSLLAAPHSMTELKAQLAKTAITVVDVLLWDFPKVQGVVFALCTVSTFYFHMKQLPYYTAWMNSFRLCFFAVHMWVAVHLCVLVFAVDAKKVKKGGMGFIQWDIANYDTAKIITDSMAYGVPAIFFAAGVAAAVRLFYFFRVALKFQRLQLQPNLYSKRVHRFSDEKDVEICARVMRVWDEDGNVDPACLDLAEVVIRAGIQQFPKSPFLHIVYANLLIECRQQLQSGWTQMELARRMPLNLSYRFSIFTREQEHKQKAAVSSSGESAADLVSYVEFQRNWRLIQSYHKAALMALREFWRLLLHDAVNLDSLTRAFRKIEQMEKLADRTYKNVLERYPKAVKLLRSYANFLETVKNDPWTAAQYAAEAEKQEEALENAENDLTGEGALTMRNSAIITINSMGLIQMANKHALKMLGYNRGDLDGKNVSCLMPQPFSARHNGYLRNYVNTGKNKILNEVREVVALHHERYVFPIRIMVTKTQGTGADSVFMALLREVEADPNQIKAWLMPNGVTLCADQSFTDYAGWAPTDLIGKHFSAICADVELVNNLLERAGKFSEEELAAGAVQADIMLLHKYAEEVPVKLRVEMGGTADQRLLVLKMTRMGDMLPTIVFDHHGRVLFANQAICNMLGTKPKAMRGVDIATLLPQPFGYLHHRWIKESEASLAKPPPVSCRVGAVHSLLSSNGVHVPVRMTITSRELSDVHLNIVRAVRVTTEQALDEQRVCVTMDQHGHILTIGSAHHAAHDGRSHSASGPAPDAHPPAHPDAAADAAAAARANVFGFDAANLVGRKLHESIDVFAEWHAQGHSVMHAMKALSLHATAQPGAAWRVGVLPHHLTNDAERAALRVERAHIAEDGTAAAAASSTGPDPEATAARVARRNATLAKRSVRRSSSMRGPRPAVMQVLPPEHTPSGTLYTIRLWRHDLLSGVIEMNDRMNVIKADAIAGLLFGVAPNSMTMQPLSRFLKLPTSKSAAAAGSTKGGSTKSGAKPSAPRPPPPPGGPIGAPMPASAAAAKASVKRHSGSGADEQKLLSMESLLGNKGAKGGMKGKAAHKTGPRLVFEARHADGLPLTVSLQAALKNGTSSTRLMAVIKATNIVLGNVAVLHAVMRGEDLGHTSEAASPSIHAIRASNAALLHARLEAQAQAEKEAKAKVAAAAAAFAAAAGVGGLAALGASKSPSKGKAAGVPALPLGKLGAPPADSSAGTTPSGAAAALPPGMGSARTLNGDGKTVMGSNNTRSDGVVTVGGVNLLGLNSAGQSDVPGSALATARDVGLEFGATPRPNDSAKHSSDPDGGVSSPSGSGPASGNTSGPVSATGGPDPASAPGGSRPGSRQLSARRLQSPSPLQKLQTSASSGSGGRPISDDSAMARPHGLGGGGGGGGGDKERLGRRHLTREWQDVVHVDPEQVPIPHDVEYDIDHHAGDEKDMTVSTASSSDSDGSGSEAGERHAGTNTEGAADKMTREEALQRKKTMAALEPGERAQYVRGVKRVKEWLASGYYFDQRDAEPAEASAHSGNHAHPHSQAAHGGGGGGEAVWRKRQLSRVIEEGESPVKGGGGGDGPALNPDDQLMTLEELAEEMERQETLQTAELEDEEAEEEREREAERERQRLEAEEASRRGGASRRGAKGGSVAGRSDGVGAASRAATMGAGAFSEAGGKSVAGASEAGSEANGGMTRGRRLKRLLKLLSGRQVSRGVSRLRLHVLILIGLMLLVHAVCFLLIIIYINKQKQFITEISAAGEAIDVSHYAGMYSRAVEGATRYAGFAPSDIPSLAARLDGDVDRLEYLHQGLYLGFGKLQRSPSKQLKDLWDVPQWNTTVYLDTKVPTYTSEMMTLWNLGNDYISAAREVAFYASSGRLFIPGASSLAAATANASANGTLLAASPPPPLVSATAGTPSTNVTLPLNRFWLYVRANVGESLYTGYLRVLNTLLLLAQDNIAMLKLIMILMLVVEGCAVCFAAICYVFWLLWKASRARAALFTVFLVIPQGQIKTLASRNITTNQDDDSDDEDDRRDEAATAAAAVVDGASDGASVVSGAPSAAAGGGRRSSIGMFPDRSAPSVASKKPGIKFNEETEEQHEGTKATVLGRIKRALSRDVLQGGNESEKGPPRRFHTKKRLTHTTTEIRKLAWPFFAWGLLICVIYLVSYLQFAGVEESMVNLKMVERSTAQASRTMFYATELALEADRTVQAALQAIVREEASWLDSVYSTALYGGDSLADGQIDGAHDRNTGSLFAGQEHASLLFERKACLRDSSSRCLATDDPFYTVSRNAIDPMMRRLMREAELLGLDDLRDVNGSSTRWQYVWTVAQEDLHDGLEVLVSDYQADALAAFQAQGTLHTVIFAISWVLWAAYVWLLLKPYLAVAATETKRVAELLSQLPPELDVEGMVEESWLVVADTQLDRSGLSIWDPRNHSVANLAVKSAYSVFTAVRLASTVAARRFSIASRPDDAASQISTNNAVVARFRSMAAARHRASAEAANSARGDAVSAFSDGADADAADGARSTMSGATARTARQALAAASAFFQPTRRTSVDAPQPTDGRPGSMKRPRSGRVASMDVPRGPQAGPSARWVEDEGAVGGAVPSGAAPRSIVDVMGAAALASPGAAGERPYSPLLDFPMGLILPPVAEHDTPVALRAPAAAAAGGGVGAWTAAAATPPQGPARQDSHASPGNAYRFNRVMTVEQSTREFDDDNPWAPSWAMPRQATDLSAAPPQQPRISTTHNLPVLREIDEVTSPTASNPGSRLGSVNHLALPPPAPVATALAAAASARQRLGAGPDSRPGSALAPAAPLASGAGAGAGSIKVVDRRRSLESSSRPASGAAPLQQKQASGALRAGTASGALGQPGSPAAALAGQVLSVQSRRSSLDAAGSRPASRLGVLSPTAAAVAMPPAPSFNAAAASPLGASRQVSKAAASGSARQSPVPASRALSKAASISGAAASGPPPPGPAVEPAAASVEAAAAEADGKPTAAAEAPAPVVVAAAVARELSAMPDDAPDAASTEATAVPDGRPTMLAEAVAQKPAAAPEEEPAAPGGGVARQSSALPDAPPAATAEEAAPAAQAEPEAAPAAADAQPTASP